MKFPTIVGKQLAQKRFLVSNDYFGETGVISPLPKVSTPFHAKNFYCEPLLDSIRGRGYLKNGFFTRREVYFGEVSVQGIFKGISQQAFYRDSSLPYGQIGDNFEICRDLRLLQFLGIYSISSHDPSLVDSNKFEPLGKKGPIYYWKVPSPYFDGWFLSNSSISQNFHDLIHRKRKCLVEGDLCNDFSSVLPDIERSKSLKMSIPKNGGLQVSFEASQQDQTLILPVYNRPEWKITSVNDGLPAVIDGPLKGLLTVKIPRGAKQIQLEFNIPFLSFLRGIGIISCFAVGILALFPEFKNQEKTN